jgi:hypothetical protein
MVNRRIAKRWRDFFARRGVVLLQPELALGIRQVATAAASLIQPLCLLVLAQVLFVLLEQRALWRNIRYRLCRSRRIGQLLHRLGHRRQLLAEQKREASQQVSAMAMNPSHKPRAMLPLNCKVLSWIGNGRRGLGR